MWPVIDFLCSRAFVCEFPVTNSDINIPSCHFVLERLGSKRSHSVSHSASQRRVMSQTQLRAFNLKSASVHWKLLCSRLLVCFFSPQVLISSYVVSDDILPHRYSVNCKETGAEFLMPDKLSMSAGNWGTQLIFISNMILIWVVCWRAMLTDILN